jgi:hypothetical protein
MRQSPLWREFKRISAGNPLSAEQIEASSSLAREFATALRQQEAADFIDTALPSQLELLLAPLAATPEHASPDPIEVGKELLAADVIESVNNTLKRIAEGALQSLSEYAKGFQKGFRDEATTQGPKDGAKAFNWLRRITIAGAAGTGSYLGLAHLIAKYPQAFGWLERLLQMLN